MCFKLNSLHRHSGTEKKTFIVLLMRKCSPIIMTHGRCSAVHSAEASPVYKHRGRLLAFVTARSWQLLPPVCPEGERETERKGEDTQSPCKASLDRRKRFAIDLQEFTLELEYQYELFWWDLEFLYIFAARNRIGGRHSRLAISMPLLSSPHLRVRNVFFFPAWSSVSVHCASWKDLFIYSADVGTGAAGSPWLLHSHVTHEAESWNTAAALIASRCAILCLWTFIYPQPTRAGRKYSWTAALCASRRNKCGRRIISN